MYIYDKILLEEIGSGLNISRRTLFYWKKKYEWNRKIFKTELNQEIFSEELLNFARKLMDFCLYGQQAPNSTIRKF